MHDDNVAMKDSEEVAQEIDTATAEDYDFLIIGGGILGTAVAFLAAEAGYGVIVVRLNDESRPRADTLRNQGWLQSGCIYKRSDFPDVDTYLRVVRRTLTGGRDMLRGLGIPPSPERAVVRVQTGSKKHLEFEARRKLLRIQDISPVLKPDEAEKQIGPTLYEAGSTYYSTPDSPFDEALVVQRLRAQALDAGARFINLTAPVTLERGPSGLRVHIEGLIIEPPMTLIAAGAGTVRCLSDLGQPPMAELRQTPLMVYCGDHAASLPPIFIDFERGFSSVRHRTASVASGAAVVVGTKVHRTIEFRQPEARRIESKDISDFKACLSDTFTSFLPEARFTAGFELIPLDKSRSFLAPWIEDLTDVVLASPGRATLGWMAAREVFLLMLSKLSGAGRQRIEPVSAPPWECQIHMHFSDHYSFTDAEEA